MKTAYTRTAVIIVAFLAGALLPQAHVAVFLVRWFVMTMLYIVFLNTPLSGLRLRASHLAILGANIALGFLAWGAGYAAGGREIALALFFAGIAPTATAATVIISFMRGRAEYVVTVFLLTNLVIALLLPVMIPLVLGVAAGQVVWRVFGTVALVVFLPITAAWITRTVHPAARGWPLRLRNLSFAIWIANLFLVISNASHFLRGQTSLPFPTLALIGSLSALLCIANFGIGRLIGRPDFAREAAQSLGQKNTAFTIYLALVYANPLVALGPTFYVLWHNIWNSWQLHRAAMAERGR